MGLINYLGNSKVIKRICQLLNVTDVQDEEGHSLVDENGIAIVSGGGSGSSTLAGLTDVDVTGASGGDVLALNGTSGKWEDKKLPTKLSDFTNDTGFITNTVNNLTNYYKKSETYTQSEVDALISAVVTIDIEVVQTLPTTDISTTTIYLLPKQTAGTDDVYDEYINTTGTTSGWELIGSTQVDLSNYYTKSEVDALIPDELADLADDSTHRLVTDTEKSTWSAKVSDNPTFSEASTRANIDSGDSFATILGKIKKFFTDLKTVAFTGAYSDLTGQPTIPTDTNVKQNNSIGNAPYRVLLSSSYQDDDYTGETKKSAKLSMNPSTGLLKHTGDFDNDGNITSDRTNGTTSVSGTSYIIGGNSTPSGTTGNSRGILRLYGTNDKYFEITESGTLTANRTLNAPNKDGTIAVTSDLSKKSNKTRRVTLSSSSFTYDSGAKYWYSNYKYSYYYGTREIFDIQIIPSYAAINANAYINSNGYICVAGIVTTNMTAMDSQYTFTISILQEKSDTDS